MGAGDAVESGAVEHALRAGDEAIAIRCDSFQQRLEASRNVAVQHGLAAGAQDAQVYDPGV